MILLPSTLLTGVGLTAVLLSGCATPYGCKGMPDDPKCLSTTDAYQLTNKALPDPINIHNTTPVNQSIKQASGLPPPKVLPTPKIDDPTPIRTPAQVMRIWIAPWEDSDGDLMVSNYVYTEVEPRRWMIGKSAPTLSPSLVPLQVEQRLPEKPMEREPVEGDAHKLPHGGL